MLSLILRVTFANSIFTTCLTHYCYCTWQLCYFLKFFLSREGQAGRWGVFEGRRITLHSADMLEVVTMVALAVWSTESGCT